ncbi:alkaline phosphatase family protein [Natronococcus jeotgali]|uniref:Sulfatase N-terminal domain-containing protein n=1 Tax=Natronococcus jeotgali DSM 18795 TaxID=1227498 RepID=L9X496_9EURY|nr:hypothetical protein [Natronococcus jeotgali]ELY56594.1 hypothetical protein C492_14334 [Natronococcus jeotgali DSM 18795]
MSQYDWSLENVKKGLKHPGRALDEVALEYLYRFPAARLNGRRPIGTNVFDREWDVLILLDTCRVDALEAVADEYDFLGAIDSIRSVGGGSAEWIARTFDEAHRREIANTAYLSANGHLQQVLEDRRHEVDPGKHLTYRALRAMPTVGIDALGKAEYLFRYEPWGVDGERGHVDGMTPPRYVTDRAISVSRAESYDRTILHYFQPHSPWVSNALEDDRELYEYEDDWWGYLTETGDVETVWNAYLDDLRYVLDDVELLLENLDAERVVISADHGEAFGEYGVLGHKIGSLHPKIRRVPWAETTAEDRHTREPTVSEPDDARVDSESLEAQLEALGYKV